MSNFYSTLNLIIRSTGILLATILFPIVAVAQTSSTLNELGTKPFDIASINGGVCGPTQMFRAETLCQKESQSGSQTIKETWMIASDKLLRFYERKMNPVKLSDRQWGDSVRTYNTRFAKEPKTWLQKFGNNKSAIVGWGDFELDEVSLEERRKISLGDLPPESKFIDFLGDLPKSAKANYPVYKIRGQLAFIWSSFYNPDGIGWSTVVIIGKESPTNNKNSGVTSASQSLPANDPAKNLAKQSSVIQGSPFLINPFSKDGFPSSDLINQLSTDDIMWISGAFEDSSFYANSRKISDKVINQCLSPIVRDRHYKSIETSIQECSRLIDNPQLASVFKGTPDFYGFYFTRASLKKSVNDLTGINDFKEVWEKLPSSELAIEARVEVFTWQSNPSVLAEVPIDQLDRFATYFFRGGAACFYAIRLAQADKHQLAARILDIAYTRQVRGRSDDSIWKDVASYIKRRDSNKNSNEFNVSYNWSRLPGNDCDVAFVGYLLQLKKRDAAFQKEFLEASAKFQKDRTLRFAAMETMRLPNPGDLGWSESRYRATIQKSKDQYKITSAIIDIAKATLPTRYAPTQPKR
jgi:hypothetical protein